MGIEESISKILFPDNNISAEDKVEKILKEIKEVKDLQDVLDNMKISAYVNLVNKWYDRIANEWKNVKKDSDNNGFYIEILGVKCGCWAPRPGGDEKAYWGFMCNEGTDLLQMENLMKNVVKPIIKEAREAACKGIEEDSIKKDLPFIAWNYTDDGYGVCSAFYSAAKKLDFMQNEK